MPWSRSQIITVQIYRRAAGLSDIDYRHMLKTHTGAFSSRDRSLGQYHFDVFMPVLEMHVEQNRDRTGRPLPKQIREIRHWRTRCPKDGAMNTRQRHKILELWDQLKPHLDDAPAHCTPYLAAMATKATGYRVGDFWSMKAWQANLLIEALKDRLRHAIRRAS